MQRYFQHLQTTVGFQNFFLTEKSLLFTKLPSLFYLPSDLARGKNSNANMKRASQDTSFSKGLYNFHRTRKHDPGIYQNIVNFAYADTISPVP